jgi:hypothetical protein
MSHLRVSWTSMDCTDLRRGIFRTPLWFGQLVVLLLIILEHVCNRTWGLLQFPWCIEEIHYVVLVTNLIWQAACPSLDLVELVVLFVVARLAHVDLLVLREVARPTLVVPGDEHNEAAVHDFVDAMITILTSLDHFVFQKVSIETMHSLLGSVVPTGVHPLSAIRILPGAINLGHDGLGEIVRILYVHPVADLPELAVV